MMPSILYIAIVTVFLPIVLAWVGGIFRYREFGKIDNDAPRTQQSRVTGAGARAIAAQQNAWEAAIMFSTSVLVAHASSADLHSLSLAAWFFLLARLLHAVFYIAGFSALRSLAFIIGMSTCIYIALSAQI